MSTANNVSLAQQVNLAHASAVIDNEEKGGGEIFGGRAETCADLKAIGVKESVESRSK